MTLEDYARVYARRCAARTTFRFVRPLRAYRVVNSANENTRAPFSPLLPSRGHTEGAGSPAARPRLCSINPHSAIMGEF